ncbi:hypothetical protein N1851_001648 [Merluccius polli]|uniref:Uncharacterized protein n=1 Tax=Merluccius polli TaxID=89951 RepID=A0AA47P9A4_MERPO|nr:hypothetical protein N1851_001648 [Merluccius polli]
MAPTCGTAPEGLRTAETGYVLLVILMIAIVVLCWILVALRRKSRYPVLLMEPPGTFEMNNMEGLKGLLSLELPPSSSCLPLDTEQTDKKGDQSDDVSLHITEEEQ